MDDATYTFIQHQREMNIIKRNAKYKRSGRKTKYVGLPSDSLTAKQKKEMNGPVKQYDMSVPHTYGELKEWPKDIASEYLESIIEKYKAGIGDLARMLKTKNSTLKALLADLEIQIKRGKKTSAQMQAWGEFLYGGTEKIPAKKQEPEQKPAAVVLPTPPVMNIKTLNLWVEGKPYAVAQWLPMMLDTSKTYIFDITVREKREEEKEPESSICEAEQPCDYFGCRE